MRERKVCCCFGHRDVFKDITEKLDTSVARAIEDGCTTFMTGGDGEFDMMFASAVRRAKKNHPHITLKLIKPYFSNTWNTQQEYFTALYDEIIVPEELASIHFKGAITHRNRWMADKADVIIAYVRREFGGAYTAIEYAKKQNKQIFYIT